MPTGKELPLCVTFTDSDTVAGGHSGWRFDPLRRGIFGRMLGSDRRPLRQVQPITTCYVLSVQNCHWEQLCIYVSLGPNRSPSESSSQSGRSMAGSRPPTAFRWRTSSSIRTITHKPTPTTSLWWSWRSWIFQTSACGTIPRSEPSAFPGPPNSSSPTTPAPSPAGGATKVRLLNNAEQSKSPSDNVVPVNSLRK